MVDEYKVSPWQPTTDPLELKALGKLAEETGELTSAAARCIIQGVNECEPTTDKENWRWLEEEISDVLAASARCVEALKLDKDFIEKRLMVKLEGLRRWHEM